MAEEKRLQIEEFRDSLWWSQQREKKLNLARYINQLQKSLLDVCSDLPDNFKSESERRKIKNIDNCLNSLAVDLNHSFAWNYEDEWCTQAWDALNEINNADTSYNNGISLYPTEKINWEKRQEIRDLITEEREEKENDGLLRSDFKQKLLDAMNKR